MRLHDIESALRTQSPHYRHLLLIGEMSASEQLCGSEHC